MNNEEKLLLEETREIILLNKDLPGGMDVITESMNKVYIYFKSVIKEATFRDKRILEISKLERLLKDKFLPLNLEPIFDEKENILIPGVIKDEFDCELILNYIVHKVRCKLNESNDIKNSSLEKLCITSSFRVERVCEDIKVQQKRFHCSEDLSHGWFHCFNVITFRLPNNQEKRYLVDCTYRQFFTYSYSFLERIGMPLNLGASLGRFMIMDDNRKVMAEELLTKGYIEFNPGNIKSYFDGFVFSGRNGLYYESLNKKIIEKDDYVPSYTFKDYLDALKNNGLKDEKFIGRQFGIIDSNIIFSDVNTKGRVLKKYRSE